MNYEPLMARFEDTTVEIVSERGERFITSTRPGSGTRFKEEVCP